MSIISLPAGMPGHLLSFTDRDSHSLFVSGLLGTFPGYTSTDAQCCAVSLGPRENRGIGAAFQKAKSDQLPRRFTLHQAPTCRLSTSIAVVESCQISSNETFMGEKSKTLSNSQVCAGPPPYEDPLDNPRSDSSEHSQTVEASEGLVYVGCRVWNEDPWKYFALGPDRAPYFKGSPQFKDTVVDNTQGGCQKLSLCTSNRNSQSWKVFLDTDPVHKFFKRPSESYTPLGSAPSNGIFQISVKIHKDANKSLLEKTKTHLRKFKNPPSFPSISDDEGNISDSDSSTETLTVYRTPCVAWKKSENAKVIHVKSSILTSSLPSPITPISTERSRILSPDAEKVCMAQERPEFLLSHHVPSHQYQYPKTCVGFLASALHLDENGTTAHESLSKSNETIAGIQYQMRGGILWDTANKVLKNYYLHSLNLTQSEFIALACGKGGDTATWLNENVNNVTSRVMSQWINAHDLLRKAGIKARELNKTSLYVFEWMAENEQLAFIAAYKKLERLVLASMRGLQLSEKEMEYFNTLNLGEKEHFIRKYQDEKDFCVKTFQDSGTPENLDEHDEGIEEDIERFEPVSKVEANPRDGLQLSSTSLKTSEDGIKYPTSISLRAALTSNLVVIKKASLIDTKTITSLDEESTRETNEDSVTAISGKDQETAAYKVNLNPEKALGLSEVCGSTGVSEDAVNQSSKDQDGSKKPTPATRTCLLKRPTNGTVRQNPRVKTVRFDSRVTGGQEEDDLVPHHTQAESPLDTTTTSPREYDEASSSLRLSMCIERAPHCQTGKPYRAIPGAWRDSSHSSDGDLFLDAGPGDEPAAPVRRQGSLRKKVSRLFGSLRFGKS